MVMAGKWISDMGLPVVLIEVRMGLSCHSLKAVYDFRTPKDAAERTMVSHRSLDANRFLLPSVMYWIPWRELALQYSVAVLVRLLPKDCSLLSFCCRIFRISLLKATVPIAFTIARRQSPLPPPVLGRTTAAPRRGKICPRLSLQELQVDGIRFLRVVAVRVQFLFSILLILTK